MPPANQPDAQRAAQNAPVDGQAAPPDSQNVLWMGGIIRPVEDDVIKTGAEQAEWHADQGQIQQGIEGNVVAGRQAVADETVSYTHLRAHETF